jgi:hypothetical protein
VGPGEPCPGRRGTINSRIPISPDTRDRPVSWARIRYSQRPIVDARIRPREYSISGPENDFKKSPQDHDQKKGG